AEANTSGKWMSVTMADYDLDGNLDLFVTNGRGVYPFNNGPDQLYRNLGSGNNWLQIDLEGKVSNRDGIGARLFATTPDGKTQLRERNGGIHWAQQNQKRIHFGLAQNEIVSELVIYWPSGNVQKLEGVKVNQVLQITEEGTELLATGDVNLDGKVNIVDLLIIVAHFGENPPSNHRYDTNKDGKVDLQDVVFIIETIEDNSAAPSVNSGSEADSDLVDLLSDEDIELLSTFSELIEELAPDSTQITIVKRFLENLLLPIKVRIRTKLHSNYPNPFNPETWIPYQLAKDSDLKIRIYDTSAKVVRTVYSGYQKSGYHISREKAAYWNGLNDSGEKVASGVYYYELVTPSFKQTRKLVIIK
ncbi:ASPIC/UnbV domain-containing protein, partial [Candidatus Poribacteria bacterium]|nr:ASPIC/UnbV domain-containing protein [Candidatus Poribacteria bacterium]